MLKFLFRKVKRYDIHEFYSMWVAHKKAEELVRNEYYLGIKVI